MGEPGRRSTKSSFTGLNMSQARDIRPWAAALEFPCRARQTRAASGHDPPPDSLGPAAAPVLRHRLHHRQAGGRPFPAAVHDADGLWRHCRGPGPHAPERLRTPLPWIIAISACAVTIQGALLFWGLRGMQATAANLILQIQVPFVVVLGWIVGGEAVVMRKAAGTVIALLGVGIVIGLPEQPPPLATLAVIAGGFVWALGQVFASHHGRDTGIGTLKLNAYGSVPQRIAAHAAAGAGGR